MIRRAYYFNEDVIYDDESDYGDFDDNECLFLALKYESTTVNTKRCVKESAMEKFEGTMISALHAKS